MTSTQQVNRFGTAELEVAAPQPVPVHHRVAGHARAIPDAPALSHGDRVVTYRELAADAARIASALTTAGIGAGHRVGLVMARGPELVAAMLGVLQTGAAYVPVDVAYPRERRDFLLRDCGAAAVLADDDLVDGLQAAAGIVLGHRAAIAAGTATTGDGPAGPRDLAYVVYTSGSTGTPKGVMVEHAELSRLVADPMLDVRPGQTVAQVAPTSFDASVFEIWGALAHGAHVVMLAERTLSAPVLGTWLRHTSPDWLFLTSALFQALVDHDPGALSAVGTLITGGDVLSPRAVRTAALATRTFAAYGPTETTVFASLHRVDPARDLERVPIGAPLADVRMLVLDEKLREVGPGVVGELYLAGPGVARGYLDRAGLSAERFVADVSATEPGERMYRTGDLAARLEDGEFEFHGRVDRQVKIRGFRVEPGEVETVLAAHPGVSSAVADVFDEGPDLKRLAAFVVPAPGVEVTAAGLLRYLAEKLPAYLHPAGLVLLPEMPRDPNGKPDRRALPYPWKRRADLGLEEAYVAPRTPRERVMAQVWTEVLGLDTVGVDDNFFQLGGDSLRSVTLLSRLNEQNIEVVPDDLFDYQTIAELVAAVGTGRD